MGVHIYGLFRAESAVAPLKGMSRSASYCAVESDIESASP